MAYQINKSIGKTVEFKGLKSQYLLYFAAGMLGVFFLFVIMKVLGIPVIISAIITVGCGVVFTNYIFKLNKKYGAHGAMKLIAHNACPRFIINRKPIYKILGLAVQPRREGVATHEPPPASVSGKVDTATTN